MGIFSRLFNFNRSPGQANPRKKGGRVVRPASEQPINRARAEQIEQEAGSFLIGQDLAEQGRQQAAGTLAALQARLPSPPPPPNALPTGIPVAFPWAGRGLPPQLATPLEGAPLPPAGQIPTALPAPTPVQSGWTGARVGAGNEIIESPAIAGHTGVSIDDPDEVGEPMQADMVDQFLQGGFAVFVQSSNVEWLMYQKDAAELWVGFKAKGNHAASTYRYWPINLNEARASLTAISKGTYVWDHLRIRGTKYGHKKNYARVR